MACKQAAKAMLDEETPPQTAPSPAASAVAAPAPATAAPPVSPAAAAAAAAAVASAALAANELAPAAKPFDGKYSLDGIRQIPANCKAPHVILTTVTQGVFDSGKLPWNFARQVFLANQQFKYSTLTLSGGASNVLLRGAAHKPTKGVALVADCNSADTCMQVAAVYKTVVPTSNPEVVCGNAPTLGESVATFVFEEGQPLKANLPPKDNVVQQCVRLAACQARRDGKLDGDPGIECQRKPSSFQLRCSFKDSCDDVMSCVGKATAAK